MTYVSCKARFCAKPPEQAPHFALVRPVIADADVSITDADLTAVHLVQPVGKDATPYLLPCDPALVPEVKRLARAGAQAFLHGCAAAPC